jgi:hypothetical protein
VPTSVKQGGEGTDEYNIDMKVCQIHCPACPCGKDSEKCPPLHKKNYIPRVPHLKANITYRCDRKCPNCNRATRLIVPSFEEDLAPDTFRKMLEECVGAGKTWTRITLTGGEPTMHPKFNEFVDILMEYKRKHLPKLNAGTYTYHHPVHFHKIEEALKKYPDFVVFDTSKDKPRIHMWASLKAPMDDKKFKEGHDYGGCGLGARLCGLGWDQSGFYCCPVGANIARVFRLDVAVKRIGDLSVDKLTAQYKHLCSRCGDYVPYRANHSEKDILSPSWIDAIRKLNAKRRKA